MRAPAEGTRLMECERKLLIKRGKSEPNQQQTAAAAAADPTGRALSALSAAGPTRRRTHPSGEVGDLVLAEAVLEEQCPGGAVHGRHGLLGGQAELAPLHLHHRTASERGGRSPGRLSVGEFFAKRKRKNDPADCAPRGNKCNAEAGQNPAGGRAQRR